MSPPGKRALLQELERRGLLLASDAVLPSVSSFVAGEPVRGSWWGHPAAHAIFEAQEMLEGSGVATAIHLVDAKVTWVHWRLWPHLLRIGAAGEAWQVDGLSRSARALLGVVRERGEVLLDSRSRIPVEGKTAAARELEARLLVHAGSVHTVTGAHARLLRSWERWSAAAGVTAAEEAPQEARERFEALVAAWAASGGRHGRLPWSRPTRSREGRRSR